MHCVPNVEVFELFGNSELQQLVGLPTELVYNPCKLNSGMYLSLNYSLPGKFCG